MRRALLILVLVGCRPADPVEYGHPTRFVLSPQLGDGDVALEELFQVAEAWIDRWSLASGLAIAIGAGGIPLAFREDLAEATSCAETHTSSWEASDWYRIDAVYIDPHPIRGCADWRIALGHELGHVIAGPKLGVHAQSGVFQATMKMWRGMDVIDEESLGVVCSVAPCTLFAPER